MSRPKKKRCIYNDPGLRYFKPRGIPLTELDIIRLELDENGTINYLKLNPILYAQKTYWSLKDKIGYRGFSHE